MTKPLHLLLPAPVTRRPGRGSPPRIPSSPGRVDADDGPCGQGRCEAGCHLVDRGDRFTKCIISISLIVTINVITVHHPHLHSLTHTHPLHTVMDISNTHPHICTLTYTFSHTPEHTPYTYTVLHTPNHTHPHIHLIHTLTYTSCTPSHTPHTHPHIHLIHTLTCAQMNIQISTIPATTRWHSSLATRSTTRDS